MKLKDKDLIKWVVIGILGGSGTFTGKSLIEKLWEPYKLVNEKRTEEQQIMRLNQERQEYWIRVVSHQLSGKTLQKSIEAVNLEENE